MPIYFQIEGIQGDATQQDHKNWMDIQSMNWNVARNINTLAGAAANREASEPAVSEVTLTKISDSSTTKLFQESCTGRTGKTATIHLVTTGNPGDVYIEYKLYNTLIASYNVGSSGDRPNESITLNFTKMDVKYTPFDENNNPKSPMIASFDLATAKST